MFRKYRYVAYYMSCSDVAVQKEVSGAALEVTVSCQTCGYKFVKSTSECIGGKHRGRRMASMNYLLSCAILFAGATVRKVLRYSVCL